MFNTLKSAFFFAVGALTGVIVFVLVAFAEPGAPYRFIYEAF